MATLSHRLQVLIDDQRFSALERRASRDGMSVGEFVRRAIDVALEDEGRREKQKALLELLPTLPRIDFDSFDDMKKAIEEAHVSPEFWD